MEYRYHQVSHEEPLMEVLNVLERQFRAVRCQADLEQALKDVYARGLIKSQYRSGHYDPPVVKSVWSKDYYALAELFVIVVHFGREKLQFSHEVNDHEMKVRSATSQKAFREAIERRGFEHMGLACFNHIEWLLTP